MQLTSLHLNMSSEVSYEMRDRAYRMCRDYLNGAWKMIGAQNMIIKHISGGMSNLLYYCALPSSTSASGSEPAEVLVRFYGQVHGEEALESLLAESVIFALLSERRLGPTLYGVFPGGRLEQYIPARSLTTQELAVPEISREIAIRMARMHALNVPINKEPTWIWNSMERWLKSSEEFLRPSSSNSLPGSASSTLEKLRQFPYNEELSHVRRLVSHIKSPVVFAHNDMQEGNILINNNFTKLSEKISLIDFEYCSYNYRGFDLANHFCEWTYCYKLPVEPFFTADTRAFPNRDQQLNFIRTYLAAFESSFGRKGSLSLGENGIISNRKATSESSPSNFMHSSTNGSSSPPITSTSSTSPTTTTQSTVCTNEGVLTAGSHPAEEGLLLEVKVFTLASHLLWSLWGIVQGHVSKIPFNYLDYALTRMEHYYETKSQLKSEEIVKRKSEQLEKN